MVPFCTSYIFEGTCHNVGQHQISITTSQIHIRFMYLLKVCHPCNEQAISASNLLELTGSNIEWVVYIHWQNRPPFLRSKTSARSCWVNVLTHSSHRKSSCRVGHFQEISFANTYKFRLISETALAGLLLLVKSLVNRVVTGATDFLLKIMSCPTHKPREMFRSVLFSLRKSA